ncbi:hypothetical protein [Haloarcula montana]|nr:hypothetical protein [Haloarcula sp. GH36]
METVQTVTPDVITKELIQSISHGKEDLAGEESSMDVCTECIDELTGE